jgi:gliding motility-associated-like protein
MEEKDFIKDLFQEKLSKFETPVRPEVWSAVSSSIGASAASTGLSLIAKLIIGTSLTAAVATGIWFAVSNSENEIKPKQETTEIEKPSVVETKEESRIKEINQPKFSDVQIKTSVDKYKLLTPEPAFNFETDENPFDATPNNSISEFKGIDSKEVKDLIPPMEDNTNPKVENVISNQNPNSKQSPIQSDIKISLPNVFTPNGDGNNDFFTIPKVDLTDFSLVLLDEKGKTIFTSTDLDFNWDGTTLNGEKASVGNYVYFITAKDLSGKSFTKYSNLSIRY